MKNLKLLYGLLLLLSLAATGFTYAAPPATKNGVTTIHLDEYNGYFASKETLVDLKAGEYEFIITNKADLVSRFLVAG